MIGWIVVLLVLCFARFVLARTKEEILASNVFLGLYCVGSVVLTLIR